MKNINIRFLMAALALLTASSCQKEEIRTLKATFEQYESNGKAYIDDDYYACWEDDDEVSINGTACPVTLATSSGHANSAEITIPSTLSGQNLLAFYPADKISDMSATGGTVDFPHIQTYRENTAGKQIIDNPMAAHCPSDGTELKFHNLGSLLKVTIPNNEDIKAIQVKGIDNQMLCGKAQIWFNDNGEPRLRPCTGGFNSVTLRFPNAVKANGKSFYIVLPPNTNFETLTIAVLSNNGTAWATHAKTAILGNTLSTNHIAAFSYDLSHDEDYDFVADWTIRYSATQQVTPYTSTAWGTFGAKAAANNFECSKGLIVFNDIITQIGSEAFYEYSELQRITLPVTVAEIGEEAFHSCTGLISVSMPSVTTIDNSAFRDCTNLASISLTNAITIGIYAFYGCESLATVSLPNATTISSLAFSGCENLATVSLPSATTIDYSAFSGCVKLVTVEIPKVTTLGISSFSNCERLSNIYTKTATPTIGIYVFDGVPTTAVLHFPSSLSGNTWAYWPGTYAYDYDN